jgi:general stress protein YciG
LCSSLLNLLISGIFYAALTIYLLINFKIVIMTQNEKGRGLASADKETRERVSSEGGKAAHEKGTAHEFDSNEAREAGKKGGEKVSRDREHMSEIGKKGGEAR